MNSIVVTNKAVLILLSEYLSMTVLMTDFCYNVNCPANTVVIVTDKNSSFYLEEGDSVKGGAGTNSRLDYVISYETIGTIVKEIKCLDQ